MITSALIKAVMAHDEINAQQFADIASHGADGGTASGFIYYTDTVAFFDKNEELIHEALVELKDSCYGAETTMIEMLQGFGRSGDLEVVFAEASYDEDYEEYDFDNVEFDQDVVWPEEDFDNMGQKAITKDTQYKNLMAWFALEEAAKHISNLLDDEDFDTVESYGVCTEEFKACN